MTYSVEEFLARRAEQRARREARGRKWGESNYVMNSHRTAALEKARRAQEQRGGER